MKFLVTLALVAFVAARPEDAPSKPDYSRFDSLDVKTVIENPRLITSYTQCFIHSGQCPPEALNIRKVIPEAISNDCKDCSEHNKHQVATMINAIQVQRPDDWVKMNEIYNSEGKYTDSLKKFVEKYSKEE